AEPGQLDAVPAAGVLHPVLVDGVALVEVVRRQQGAASVDICRVATGSWAAFFEYGLMYWDFASAAVIAVEAGCSVRAIPCKPCPLDVVPVEFDLVVARTPELLKDIMTAVGIRPSEGTQGG
ncbi:inositol monophosphatase family protein, partial [Nonomuraea sp. NPDC004702]